MKKSRELEALHDIRRFIQAGFLAAVTVGQQIRDGKQGPPTEAEIEAAAGLLRRASETLVLDELEDEE